MDAKEVLNAIIDSDDDLDWNESSAESSEDEEGETLNLLDPLSNAEVRLQRFSSKTLYKHAISLIQCHVRDLDILCCVVSVYENTKQCTNPQYTL